MGKSIIPFIFENSLLNNIFIEAASAINISDVFYLQEMKLENLKDDNFNNSLMDCSSLKKFLKQSIQINKIFLIDYEKNINFDFKIDNEVIKINTFIFKKNIRECRI